MIVLGFPSTPLGLKVVAGIGRALKSVCFPWRFSGLEYFVRVDLVVPPESENGCGCVRVLLLTTCSPAELPVWSDFWPPLAPLEVGPFGLKGRARKLFTCSPSISAELLGKARLEVVWNLGLSGRVNWRGPLLAGGGSFPLRVLTSRFVLCARVTDAAGLALLAPYFASVAKRGPSGTVSDPGDLLEARDTGDVPSRSPLPKRSVHCDMLSAGGFFAWAVTSLAGALCA